MVVLYSLNGNLYYLKFPPTVLRLYYLKFPNVLQPYYLKIPPVLQLYSPSPCIIVILVIYYYYYTNYTINLLLYH